MKTYFRCIIFGYHLITCLESGTPPIPRSRPTRGGYALITEIMAQIERTHEKRCFMRLCGFPYEKL